MICVGAWQCYCRGQCCAGVLNCLDWSAQGSHAPEQVQMAGSGLMGMEAEKTMAYLLQTEPPLALLVHSAAVACTVSCSDH